MGDEPLSAAELEIEQERAEINRLYTAECAAVTHEGLRFWSALAPRLHRIAELAERMNRLEERAAREALARAAEDEVKREP